MQIKYLLFPLMLLATCLGSCATDPHRQYSPVYRTYQDKSHGGMNEWHGDVGNKHPDGYQRNGKHDRNGYLLGNL